LDELLVLLDHNRGLLAELLREQLPRVHYEPPQATYLAWLDCRDLNLPGEPVDIFLERGRVALGRGPEFGASGIGHVRLTLATSNAILCETVARMRSAVM
jgi:cysteine-S-conjugate beta-lyase